MPYRPLDVVDVYIHTFAARLDVYNRWTTEGWRPLRGELTPEIAQAGLSKAGPAISGYMIAPGGVSHLMAVDFDSDAGLTQARVLATTMSGAGLPAYVETSRRGAHLWCVLDRVVPAAVLRKALRSLLASALLPTSDPRVELRPGSDDIEEGGLGHSLRMPLMPHPKTGERGSISDASGTVLGPGLASVVLNIDMAPADTVERWAGRWNPVVERVPSTYRMPRPPRDDDDASASQILMDLWGASPITPGGREVRCPAHEDSNASLYVFPDDRRAKCHSTACILNNDDRGRGTWELTTLAPRHG